MLTKKKAVGLEIGPRNMKLVRLKRKGRGFQLNAIAEACSADDAVNLNSTLLVKECFKKAGLRPERVKKTVSGLYGSDVTVNRFDFPAMCQDELEQAIYYEASQICPYNIDRCVVDYSVQNAHGRKLRSARPESGERIRGITVVARKQAVEERLKLLKNAGTVCSVLDVHGLALLNCIDELEHGGQQKAYAAVSLNENTATVAVKLQDETCISREISIGIETVARRICEQFGLSSFQVLQRFDHASPLDKDFQKMLVAAAQELICQIGETLKFSTSQGTNKQMRCVYLCGPRGITEAFSLPLAAILPYEVIVWNPLERVAIPKRIQRAGVADKLRGASAIAIGMALRMV